MKKDRPAFKRIMLKLSGEALQGKDRYGIDSESMISIAKEIKEVRRLKCEVSVVIGGGNIFRGITRDKMVID
ncbi:MAG TPA: UMP kinase, partial [bacterium]|nr:UMP kinase [bacterium]